ncbi:hypothetical protein AR158_c330R [Paramecium bursaria Chlorella virus AR158]|uniref:hypothetical protein n=1 Tax=Paramecium bursaria Chlorella virus AR158 TaxID=380598 RepID=UPI00015AA935|nr:hypothetical protein AR158_c330R [Paramecium bursaria Chlorella virus AR158]ABU43875.1 hypothetical protein AR158_c330R [Paramecium bursaria Chlorella virus AR158]
MSSLSIDSISCLFSFSRRFLFFFIFLTIFVISAMILLANASSSMIIELFSTIIFRSSNRISIHVFSISHRSESKEKTIIV